MNCPHRATVPNKGVELTGNSVRSCVAPAAPSSSGLAFGFRKYPGISLLFFPFGTKLILGFRARLTKPIADHPQEQTRCTTACGVGTYLLPRRSRHGT
jgi:hypothetical protein